MYKTIRRIGASQFATVSECQGPLGTQLALKEYNRQALNAAQQKIVFAAADRWKKLALPGLATYYDLSDSQAFIALELFDRSAAMRLREGPSDPRLVLHTVRGLLAIMAHVHDQGYLHANLKPSNVFFESDGRLCLSDGWLLDLRSASPFPYPSNLKYLAPEQIQGEPGKLTQATDLYCIGLLGLELLAGERFARGFQGLRADTTDEDQAWSRWHLSSQVAPAATLYAKGCPDELAHVLAKLLAKSPSQRYASARHALQDLPQDISSSSKVVGNAPAAVTVPTSDSVSTQVISRPATGIVLTIASGPRAGEMLGSNENELMIGFDHDCFLRFAHGQYAWGGGKVLLRRGPQGWYVLRVAGDSIFVNQRALEEKCPLRSGDIVRLSSRGPDVQFTMQSGGIAIGSLVARFLNSPGEPIAKPLAVAAAAAGERRSGDALSPPIDEAEAPVAPQAWPSSAGTAKVESAPQFGVSDVAVERKVWGAVPAFDLRTWPALLRNVVLGVLGALAVFVLASILWPRRSSPNAPSSPGPQSRELPEQRSAVEGAAIQGSELRGTELRGRGTAVELPAVAPSGPPEN